MSNEIVAYSLNDIRSMADAVVKSKLFGVQTMEQAMALFLIAQAEGKHPATAAQEYNIINGRPALKAEAMLARFQRAGGKVEWHEITDTKVSATFSHPQGGSAPIDWDMARASQAGITGNPTWKKYPRAMLRSRVISEGVKTVYPGVTMGFFTPEEVEDMPPIANSAPIRTPINITPLADSLPNLLEDYSVPRQLTVSTPMDWTKFGTEMAAAVKQAKSLNEVQGWLDHNAELLSAMEKDKGAEKLYKRVSQRIAERQTELMKEDAAREVDA